MPQRVRMFLDGLARQVGADSARSPIVHVLLGTVVGFESVSGKMRGEVLEARLGSWSSVVKVPRRSYRVPSRNEVIVSTMASNDALGGIRRATSVAPAKYHVASWAWASSGDP